MMEKDARAPQTNVESSRRDQILDAACRVLAQQGVRGFTHRAVAGEAGVPLGLTTYYFKDRDHLLVSTIRKARVTSGERITRRIQELVAEHGFSRGIATYIEDETTQHFDELILDYRIYVSVLFQPALKVEIAAWHPEPEFARHVDDATAAMVSRLIEGYLIHAVVNSRSFTADEVLPAVERLTIH
ncbi:TetR family transcriptional regulator [Nocardioides sp. NPDC127503]|uniref:TetR/AcrR family transcriptional regulator n=1 Tax=Nocardioides sp. NPDC127503 TaxID=3154516 RepID=UPI00332AC925